MIGTIPYIVIGFIAAVSVIGLISYYDEGDNGAEIYTFIAPVLGLLVWGAWPILIPALMFSTIAWYISEEVNV